MSFPVLKNTLLHAFAAGSPLQPVEAFRAFGNDYIGVQTLFPQDEQAWDNGDPVSGETSDSTRGYGRFRGPAPLHSNVYLSIAGATYALDGHDDIASTSGAMTVTARISERTTIKGAATIRFVLQDAATGSVLSNQTVQTNYETATASLSALSSEQSAILWARVEGASPNWSLPPDYYSLSGYQNYSQIPSAYKYRVDGTEYVWDWLRDVGIRPADIGQEALSGVVMYQEYQALVESNGLQSRGEWTTYIRSGVAQSCDWSALRVVEGAGTWSAGDITPYPGAALLKLDSGAVAVNFDPLARSVCAFDTDDSAVVLAGSIASRGGPLLALWRMASDETATLLGTHPNATNHVCEFALLSNFASDTILDHDGRRLVLSLGGLHYYDDSKPIPEALPGIPRDTEGHPGGRCLREHPSSKQVLFLTENFSGPPNFYNRLQEQTAGRRTTGPGTVFHGHNCADTAFGQYFGIHQDKAFSEADAQQFVAFLQNGQWVDGGISSFPAAAYRWQRVRTVGTSDGLKTLCSGRRAINEGAIWGVADGLMFRESSLKFRPRRLTRTVGADGNERLYAVGRFVASGAVDTFWSVVSLSGEYVKNCLLWNEDGYFEATKTSFTDLGFDIDKLPLYLWWDEDVSLGGGGAWRQRGVVPPDSRPYLVRSFTTSTVRYTPDDTLPYDGSVWTRVCFTLSGGTGGGDDDDLDDGSPVTDDLLPQPGAASAADAKAQMPEGTEEIIVSKLVDDAWAAIQVDDKSDVDTEYGIGRLRVVAIEYPIAWVRVDSAADPRDLSTYVHRMSLDRLQNLPVEARERIDVCVLVPPGIGVVRVPEVGKRA